MIPLAKDGEHDEMAMPPSAARVNTTSLLAHVAPRPRRISRLAWRLKPADAHHFLRQGMTICGVQRQFVLVAEPPSRERAQSEFSNEFYLKEIRSRRVGSFQRGIVQSFAGIVFLMPPAHRERFVSSRIFPDFRPDGVPLDRSTVDVLDLECTDAQKQLIFDC